MIPRFGLSLLGRRLLLGVRQCPKYANRALCSQSDSLEERRRQVMSKGLPKMRSIEGVKDIILVVSGKGGVGKSVTTVNLASALSALDKKVGILDADIYGPSIPTLLGVNYAPELTTNKKMIPVENYGLKCMSMGLLVDQTSAMIWRGLMVMSALDKLLRQVDWGEIDFLVVDTPPGTGDILLSLTQNVPISGVVMVTSPHPLDIQVTRRGATMLEKMSLPVIGAVLNMSGLLCPHCNTSTKFNQSGIEQITKDLGIPLLAEIPYDMEIVSGSSVGKPIVIGQSKSLQTLQYIHLARKVQEFIQARPAQTQQSPAGS